MAAEARRRARTVDEPGQGPHGDREPRISLDGGVESHIRPGLRGQKKVNALAIRVSSGIRLGR